MDSSLLASTKPYQSNGDAGLGQVEMADTIDDGTHRADAPGATFLELQMRGYKATQGQDQVELLWK